MAQVQWDPVPAAMARRGPHVGIGRDRQQMTLGVEHVEAVTAVGRRGRIADHVGRQGDEASVQIIELISAVNAERHRVDPIDNRPAQRGDRRLDGPGRGEPGTARLVVGLYQPERLAQKLRLRPDVAHPETDASQPHAPTCCTGASPLHPGLTCFILVSALSRSSLPLHPRLTRCSGRFATAVPVTGSSGGGARPRRPPSGPRTSTGHRRSRPPGGRCRIAQRPSRLRELLGEPSVPAH